MTITLSSKPGYDLVRDTLSNEDLARSLYAMLDAAVLNMDEIKAAQVAQTAAQDATYDIAEIPAFDFVFVFVAEASTLYLKTADPLALPASGWVMARVNALDHLRIVNGGTAGTVLYVVAA